ncbi:hypothetical protein IJ541_04760 [bacterium]|nr:hypothetical protein [bacterium]
MLVSSIGYFKPVSTVYSDNVVNSQLSNNKNILSEGFGHFNQSSISKNKTFMDSFLDICKSIFSNDKSDNSSKYLSLIG